MPKATNHGKARSKTTARADQLRPLNLPQPVTVQLGNDELPSAIATAVRPSACLPVRPENEGQSIEATDGDLAYKTVEAIIETWHVTDEWWRKPIERRYVEVILQGGKHVVLYEDLANKDWFVQKP